MTITSLAVPVLLCAVACFALRRRVDVYAAMTRGAEEGLSVLLRILPALVPLMTAVYLFRASGAAECLGSLLSPVLRLFGIPPETAPLPEIGRMKRSGALAVGSELMERCGVDSYVGRVTAVMLGSSETTFYTVAVYFGSVGIEKTRHTVPAALCADAAMFLLSALAVRLFFPA